MKFSCDLPIDFTDDKIEFSSIEAISTMARKMEEVGFSATYVTDHPAPSSRWLAGGGHPTLDPFVALSVAATATTKLHLQTHIVVLPYRNPFVTAKSVVSLDHLSGGRMIIAVGTGYSKPQYAAVGVPFEDRGEIMTESLKVMQQAWSGEVVSYESPRFFARDTVIRPLPARKEGIPVWAGGNAKPAIRRAVELCDGWCPFPAEGALLRTTRTDELSTYEQLQDMIDFAKEHGEKVGRKKPLTICMGTMGYRQGKPGEAAYAEELIEAYSRNQEMGIDWATVGLPHPSMPEYLDNIQWFGEEVAAKVK